MTAGELNINSPTNKVDIFTPTHDMPELDAQLAKWRVIGGKQIILNKYKQLLWLLSIKDAWIKNKVPFPNGLSLNMVVRKIAEIRGAYKKDFELLNFASYDLQKQVHLAEGVPPRQLPDVITINNRHVTHNHHRHNHHYGADSQQIAYYYGDDDDDDDDGFGLRRLFDPDQTQAVPTPQEGAVGGAPGPSVQLGPSRIPIPFRPDSSREFTPQYSPRISRIPVRRLQMSPPADQNGKGKRKRKSQKGGSQKKKKWYHLIPLFDTARSWTQVI